MSTTQVLELTTEERQILRSALAVRRDYLRERVIAYAKTTPATAKQYQEMSDDTLRLLCKIEE